MVSIIKGFSDSVIKSLQRDLVLPYGLLSREQRDCLELAIKKQKLVGDKWINYEDSTFNHDDRYRICPDVYFLQKRVSYIIPEKNLDKITNQYNCMGCQIYYMNDDSYHYINIKNKSFDSVLPLSFTYKQFKLTHTTIIKYIIHMKEYLGQYIRC